jgi:predicted O-methyltransferase YrrM
MPYRLDIVGWMPEIELKHLELLATHVPENGNMLEIGSFQGRSSWAWANSIPKSATLHCIDLWPDIVVLSQFSISALNGNVSIAPFTNNFEKFLSNTTDCSNIIITKGASYAVMPMLRKHCYDLIFIDGDHTNPTFKNDLQLALNLLNSDGIICGHDFSERFPDVINEVMNLSKLLGKPVMSIEDSTIWSINL